MIKLFGKRGFENTRIDDTCDGDDNTPEDRNVGHLV
jgi:hypothetical protein